MELRHFRHFVALADELSFTKAARKLNMAQPPLSQSIRRLEASVGVELFERSQRGVELTRAGRAFEKDARIVVQHAELAGKLARCEAELVLEVRLSFIPAAMYRLLPDLLRKFGEIAPNVHVRLFEMPSPLQIAPLLAGDCDVAFIGNGNEGIDHCESLIVERGSLVAVVPADWPLASCESISLAELAEHPFILPPPQVYSTDSDTFLSLFRQAGVMPKVTQAAAHVSTTFGLIGAGLGCTITTESAVLARPRGVRFVPISDGNASLAYHLRMIWLPDQLPEVASGFIKLVRNHVADDSRKMLKMSSI